MVGDMKKQGVTVGTIVADDNTTTMSRLRKVNPNIQKKSDKNHVKKNISNRLYQLKDRHKKLIPKVIKYILKCLNAANFQLRLFQKNIHGTNRKGTFNHCFILVFQIFILEFQILINFT